MAGLQLTKTKLIGGVWEGVLTGVKGEEPPTLTLSHLNETLEGPDISKEADQWFVRVAIPTDRIADGVQTFIIAEAESGETLASFALLSGSALTDDIRSEIDLLRAELDMLKRAFRRHCVETM
ncbi:hypothetical protein SAMN04488515_2605 [Cognatiyoonia koreensis]|uniref:Uncharacterized protein n=1 Tax=Cognatiyoonia koreensis TaxID=364200 RepID=A0A1I0RFF7_9RHOB|nr:hypothetical protein [Cognatiyoonia koreensis]SEW39500.1 hypothetical protein SAMN04488515_2605 [Cognatiyoonia koreensis]